MSYDQSELEKKQNEAVVRFVEEALTKRTKELFPQISDADLPKVVEIIHNDMRTNANPKLRGVGLQEYGLQDSASIAKIANMQGSITAAIVGLGSDVMEPGAVDLIMWR